MALSIVQDIGATVNPATSITATFASGPTQNNLLVACLYADSVTATNPSGWSTAVEVADGVDFSIVRISYKVAGAGETSAVTFPLSENRAAALHIYEVNSTNGAFSSPFDQSASTGRTTGASSISSGTTGATAQANEILFALAGLRTDNQNPAMDNSFINVTRDASGAGETIAGNRIVAATGTYTTNISWSPGTTTAMAAIATFKEPAAATGAGRLLLLGVGR